MAVNIAPPNLSGMAALAGRSNNLNLTNPGLLGLKSLQIRNAQDEALRREALEKMRIRQTDEIAMRQAGMDRAKLGQRQYEFDQGQGLLRNKQLTAMQLAQQEQANKDRDFGLRQQGLGLKAGQLGLQEKEIQQKQAQQMLQKEMVELANKKKEELDNMGTFSIQALTAMNKVSDPAAAKAIQKEIVESAVANGFIPKEMKKPLIQMPIKQFKNFVEFQAMKINKAAAYKSSVPEKEKTGGTLEFTDSSGNTVKFTPLTKPELNRNIKELNETRSNLTELNTLLNKVPETMFGPSAANPALVTPGLEWLSGLPGMNKLKPKEKDRSLAESYANINGTLSRLAMDTIKQLSGVAYSDKQLQFMNQFIPEVGVWTTKTTFDGKAKGLIEYYKRVEKAKERVLSEPGVRVSNDPDSEYAKKLKMEMQKELIAPENKILKYNPSTGRLE